VCPDHGLAWWMISIGWPWEFSPFHPIRFKRKKELGRFVLPAALAIHFRGTKLAVQLLSQRLLVLEVRSCRCGCRAASTAPGFLSITVRMALAEDSGVRRPPSQCLTASRLKPKVEEKRAWVIFNRFRMPFTSISAAKLPSTTRSVPSWTLSSPSLTLPSLTFCDHVPGLMSFTDKL